MTKPHNKQQDPDREFVAKDNDPNRGENAPDGEACSCDNVADGGPAKDDIPADVSAPSDEWKDKYLRLSAEFDNYRKRTHREKADLTSFGGEDVIKALLPVLDDIDRALDAMHRSEDIAALRSGIELISQKLRDTLKNKGVEEIAAKGAELDTDFHEAVARIPVTEEAHRGKIVDVVQKGYTLKDKVVRHSKVVVGE